MRSIDFVWRRASEIEKERAAATASELAAAAGCYALAAGGWESDGIPSAWPWADGWAQLSKDDALAEASAYLICASERGVTE